MNESSPTVSNSFTEYMIIALKIQTYNIIRVVQDNDLDEGFNIERTIIEMREKYIVDRDDMPDIINECTQVLKSYNDFVRDATTSWLHFYPNDYWIFLEYGLNQFDAFPIYIFEKLEQTFTKYIFFQTFVKSPLSDTLESYMLRIIKEIGYSLFTIGLVFKNKLIQTVNIVNNEFESCEILTPQVCSYQVARLRHLLIDVKLQTELNWLIFKHANFSDVKMFIKNLLDNVENNPEIVLSDGKQPQEIKPFKKFDPESYGNILNPTEELRKSVSLIQKKNKWEDFNEEVQEFFDEYFKPSSYPTEEDDVKSFLSKHPELEERRQEIMVKLKVELTNKKLSRVESLINKSGMVAKSIYLENGDVYLVRKDIQGNKIYSKGVQSKWKNFNQISFDNSDVVMGIANSIKPHIMKGGFGNYFSQINPAILTNVQNLGFSSVSSASGTFGELLYDLLDGKIKGKHLPKELLVKTSQDLIISSIIGFSPFIAIAIAVSLGAFSIYSFVSNQTLNNKKKVLMIIELFTKSTVRSSLALGGAFIGTSLVPIPVVGSLVGGITGGFLASFTIGAISKLVKSEILIEPLTFYCLWMLDTFCVWRETAKLKGSPPVVLFEKFCKICSYVSVITPSDIEMLCKEKQQRYHRLMDSIMLKIIPPEDRKGLDKTVQKKKIMYQTMIAYSIVAYFFYLFSYKCKQLTEAGMLEEEIFLINISKFTEIVTMDSVSNLLSKNLPLLGEQNNYNRIVYNLRLKIKDKQIRSLFKQIPRKDLNQVSGQASRHHSMEDKKDA